VTTVGAAVGSGIAGSLGARLSGIAAGAAPESALGAAKIRLLHAVRVSIASRDLPAVEVAHRAFHTFDGGCLVLGRSGSLAGPDAAFVNGVAGHSSLQEDCGPGGLRDGSHPGTYVVPAALAAAEMVGTDGRSLLLGIIAGYEAVGRLGAAGPDEIVRRRFRPVGVMGPLGAAAAAAAVWKADARETAAALAVGANMAAGFTQGILEGSMEPYLHAGTAARNGLLAARLALGGVVTAAEAFEGEFGFFATYGGAAGDVDGIDDDGEFAVTRVGTKRFAACLQNQETIALIVDTGPVAIQPAEVARLRIRRPRLGTNGLNSPGVSGSPPFPNMLTAQMSARFTAAAGLLGGAVDDPEYFRRSFADPAVVELASRTDLEPTEDGSVSVVIDMVDGRRYVLDSDVSDVLRPPDSRVRELFVDHVGRFLGADRAHEALALVDRLEELTDVRELTRALRPAR
jgi:2-methylcitrate dehydratase PrpD